MKTMYFKSWQSSIANLDGIKKWFPRLVKKRRIITTLELARKTSEKSTATVGDVFNVIYIFFNLLADELMDGYTVRVDGFGTFTAVANAKGQGVDTADDVNSAQIAGIRIRFTPEYTRNKLNGVTRSMFEGVKFERIDKVANTNSQDKDDDDDYEQDPNA